MAGSVIIVGTDFSADAERALRYGFKLARALGGLVELVHVTPELKPLFGGSEASREAVARLQDEEVEAAREALETLVTETDVPAQAHVCIGDTCQALLDRADEVGAELIVVGRQGAGALGRFLLGSLTDKLVRRSERAVVVIPPGAS